MVEDFTNDDALLLPTNPELLAWILNTDPGASEQIFSEINNPTVGRQFYESIRGYTIEFDTLKVQSVYIQQENDGFIYSPDHSMSVSHERKIVRFMVTNWNEVLADQITMIIESIGGSDKAPTTSDSDQWLMWLSRGINHLIRVIKKWEELQEILYEISRLLQEMGVMDIFSRLMDVV